MISLGFFGLLIYFWVKNVINYFKTLLNTTARKNAFLSRKYEKCLKSQDIFAGNNPE